MPVRRNWEKPKLIILERGRPEELVLSGCKMLGSKITSNTKANGCSAKNNCNQRPCSIFSTS